MCGRYTLVAPVEEVRNLFDLPEIDERLLVPRYNIAPTQPIVVVREDHARRELVPVRWGLLPSWVKTPGEFPLLLNARADGVATKAAFRHAFQRRRCLVPATGFYEWQARGKTKQPFLIATGVGRNRRLRRSLGDMGRGRRQRDRHRGDRHHRLQRMPASRS